MQRRIGFLLVLLAILIAVATVQHAKAQGVQNWVNNQYSNLQQDVQNGAISPVQGNGLERRDAQIEGQAQREMNQNGGGLTAAQSQQIGRELNNVNQAAGNYANQNYPGQTYARQGYAGQYASPYSQAPQQGFQNFRGAMPGAAQVAPEQWQGQNNGGHHRHHHNQDGNQGYTGQYR